MKPYILVVEDEAALLTLLRYNLEKGGFEVGEAVDGGEALLMVDERRPDLMVLDWMLPTLSGIEVCRRIRRRPDPRPLPIVMLTARGEEADRVRGLDGGADDYVVKPFSPAELLARIRAILRRVRPALGDEVLRYADLRMDLAAHRVTRGGRRDPSRAHRVPPAAAPDGASRPRLLARAASRYRLGPGHLHREPDGRRARPPPAPGAQRRPPPRPDQDRPLGRLRPRFRRRLIGHGRSTARAQKRCRMPISMK